MYAQDFYEIPEAIEENDQLRERILDLTEDEPIPGKATEGGNRVEDLRGILQAFFEAELSIEETIQRIPSELPRNDSPHSHDNQVFASGWHERLARTQISRFYNQAVLLALQEQGEERCFIPHSDHEDNDSQCTLHLANSTADIDSLLDRLNRAYREGEWHDDVMIPDHPHCTHTVIPADGQ